MDEVNARIQPQSSICSDSNGEENSGNDVASVTNNRRICLVGSLAKQAALRKVAESFNVPIVTSDDGRDYAQDDFYSTMFVLENFEGDVYNSLCKQKQSLLGPLALQQLSNKSEPLPDNTRPLFNLSMTGVVVCFTGFRNKSDLASLVPLIHHMGGSIRKNLSQKVTHLIANVCTGEKYQYAAVFKVPAMNPQWVYASWEKRHDINFSATLDVFVAEYKLKPFHGAKVCFVGFAEDEKKHMTDILLSNGGTVSTVDDPCCTHVVVDESSVAERPETCSPKIFVVKAEWFWTSVQKELCLDEKDYLYDDYVEQTFSPSARRESHQATPSSASRRKRKRLHETLLSLAHQQSPGLHKRRSSVSDAGLLSVSGSFLDCTTSPDKALVDGTEPAIDTPRKGLTARQQVFLELVQTESNYVDILHTIMIMFKKHLEDMPEEEALLNNTELNLIFGKVPAIYETHVKMLNDMRCYASSWSEEHTIGSIIVKYSKDLLKAYPPYINYFEEMKEVLTKCDQNKPRFHAFLKACQTKPECGRQSLQELMIRPVQRLGSICLLLANLVKHTPKSNTDHAELSRALDGLKEGMDLINEDKRKAEAQVALFNMFNDIDNCPPDIVCSHRKFIAKAEVIQVSTTEGLSSKGNSLILFLFSDLVEVCKKKSKAFNNPKSPSGVSSLQRPKLYKHVKLLPLNTIKKVIDIKETEQCQKVFCFVCRTNDEVKERVYSFAMPDEDADKTAFLKTLTKQMANNACTPDADKFLAYLESHQLDIDTSDVSRGTLTKAFKFATRTRLKVGRAFSFNKTPSKLKRAVSSMMSPFGSSNNITPSSELAQMRLASYNNISELGNAENASESPPVAPMSVQPTRKMKTASLNVNALKRL
ncbi:protein ECT2 isoform X4 [Tenebrio molitor]|uniref:protein ECT2 isoform X4 n=1 Tax=Tenebrio molitor TaxID=7067 RepID=UPI0036247B83